MTRSKQTIVKMLCYLSCFHLSAALTRSGLRRPLGNCRLFTTTAVPDQGSVLWAKNQVQNKKTWLVVGDGDLSFSANLAENLQPDGTKLVASVLEDKLTHNQVYKRSVWHEDAIKACGNEVMFGVDATQLEKYFEKGQFDRVIFNFPHWRGKSNNRYNRELLDNFLQSASHVLANQGEIHMALCEGQGGMEARSLTEWRQSWMAAHYANNHGLLLKRRELFTISYDLSSHRGVDRPFSVGDQPLLYIFGHPNNLPISSDLQMSFRHELRLELDPLALSHCPHSELELTETDIVPKMITSLAPQGICTEVPIRDVFPSQHADRHVLAFLVVYSGEASPLTRAGADDIRVEVEETIERHLGLPLAKKGRMVSKPFPRPLLSSLVRDYKI